MIIQLLYAAVWLSNGFKIIVTNTTPSSLLKALNKYHLIKRRSAKRLFLFYWYVPKAKDRTRKLGSINYYSASGTLWPWIHLLKDCLPFLCLPYFASGVRKGSDGSFFNILIHTAQLHCWSKSHRKNFSHLSNSTFLISVKKFILIFALYSQVNKKLVGDIWMFLSGNPAVSYHTWCRATAWSLGWLHSPPSVQLAVCLLTSQSVCFTRTQVPARMDSTHSIATWHAFSKGKLWFVALMFLEFHLTLHLCFQVSHWRGKLVVHRLTEKLPCAPLFIIEILLSVSHLKEKMVCSNFSIFSMLDFSPCVSTEPPCMTN